MPAAQQAYTLACPSLQFRERITAEVLSSIYFLSSLKLPAIPRSRLASLFTSPRESGEISRGKSGTERCANSEARMVWSVNEDGRYSRRAAQNEEYNAVALLSCDRRLLIIGRADKKNEACDGEVGLDAGNAPTFASFVNK